MSGAPPTRLRSREMQIVRVLFDRHLLDRAVNLAEARWSGSGDMVRLAYSWPELSPSERNQRLGEMGAENLTQYRALADLHPDFAQVLNELEAQGVLLPAAIDGETPQVQDPVEQPEPEIQPDSDVIHAESEAGEPERLVSPVPDDPNDQSDWLAEDPALLEIEMPDLDLDGGSVSEFVATERERRAEAMASGAEMLERVRSRLDQAARNVTAKPPGSGPSPPLLPARMSAAVTATPGATQTAVALGEERFMAPPDYWLKRLAEEPVVVADGRIVPPTDDELVALANELGLGFAEFVIEPGVTRALFGGLVRRGGEVEVSVGPLPTALANSSLVVVRGRLYPRLLDRLRAGMCDIPGTRATVKVDPSSRVLIVPL